MGMCGYVWVMLEDLEDEAGVPELEVIGDVVYFLDKAY